MKRKTKTNGDFPAHWASYMELLRIWIGSLSCLHVLWMVEVITFVTQLSSVTSVSNFFHFIEWGKFWKLEGTGRRGTGNYRIKLWIVVVFENKELKQLQRKDQRTCFLRIWLRARVFYYYSVWFPNGGGLKYRLKMDGPLLHACTRSRQNL